MKSTLTIALVATAVVVAMIGVIPASGMGGSAAASGGAKHGAATNFTVTVNDHTPGKSGTTMSSYAAGLQTDLPVWGNLSVMFPKAQGSTCELTNARAAGVDKKNDEPGTKTDESFVGRYSEEKKGENSAGQNFTSYNFYGKDDFEGESISLRQEDQIVAQLADCWKNPDKAGWYRWWGYVNGTDPNGNFDEANAYSHWYYICDCDSYDAAVNKLGEPPTDASGSESNDGSPGTVVTKEYKLFSSGSSSGGGSGGGGGGSTATDSGGSDSTATPTSTTSSGSTGTATDTGGSGSAGTPTATGSTETATTTTGTGSNQTAATSTGNGSTGTATTATGGTGGAVTSTPTTQSHQPGFGLVAALLALVAAALLVVRHD